MLPCLDFRGYRNEIEATPLPVNPSLSVKPPPAAVDLNSPANRYSSAVTPRHFCIGIIEQFKSFYSSRSKASG
ncbi:hypothetical protein L6452_36898 [Arctium lappa]|uniref:Uncharacterized protein n=1 Tax=Arctium lappa TaxID=4217 RepID=A0ACB8Y272_ARCLA|nr:hypothetical protein L6452_36898 [Arctium lappa]